MQKKLLSIQLNLSLMKIRFCEIRQMIKLKVYQSKISSKLSRVVCPISSETITKFLGIAVKNIRQ